MSGLEVVSIIVSVAALIDYTCEVLRRVDDFSGNVKVTPKAFRQLKNTLPSLAATLKKIQARIDTAGVGDETYVALLPLVTDFQAQLKELNAIFENTVPKDDDKWFKILWKVLSSFWKDGKVEEISVTIRCYVEVLTMTFAEATDHASRDLLSISTIMSNTLMSMTVNRGLDDPWDQKPIQLADAIGKTYVVPFEVYQTTKGLVTFLMFVLKDCPAPGLKRKIQQGEFWLVDCNTERLPHRRRAIRPHSAILANTWEETPKSGKSFEMRADDLSEEELELVHKTWDDHLGRWLPKILSLTDWETSKVEERGSVTGYLPNLQSHSVGNMGI